MKTIEVDEELYRYIACHTQRIGESASDILRRLLKIPAPPELMPLKNQETSPELELEKGISMLDELLLSLHYTQQNRAVSRFILVLSTLYAVHPQKFQAAIVSIYGRTRVYFANDLQTLMQNGIHTKPKQVPQTPYWVITNTSSDRKRNILRQIMHTMQFPQMLIERVCGTIKSIVR